MNAKVTTKYNNNFKISFSDHFLCFCENDTDQLETCYY